jgi:dihydropteroate synthase
MHWRGHSTDMQSRAVYTDVTAEVVAELRPQIEAAVAAGIRKNQIIIDPGLGFAKTGEHNWTLLYRLGSLVELGFPVLVAASRKRFLGTLLADPASGRERRPDGRDAATAVLSTLVALTGAWCVRVHDVPGSLDAVKVARRWSDEAPERGTSEGPSATNRSGDEAPERGTSEGPSATNRSGDEAPERGTSEEPHSSGRRDAE